MEKLITIQHLYSETSGTKPENLELGEIAINHADKKIYTSDIDNNIVTFCDEELLHTKLDKRASITNDEIMQLVNQTKINFVDLGLSVNWSESEISKILPNVDEGVDPVTTLLGNGFRKAQNEDYSELFQNSEAVFTNGENECGYKIEDMNNFSWKYKESTMSYSWSFLHDEEKPGLYIKIKEEGGGEKEKFLYSISGKSYEDEDVYMIVSVDGGSQVTAYVPLSFKTLKFVARNGKSIDLDMRQNSMIFEILSEHKADKEWLSGENQLLPQEELINQVIPNNEFGTRIKVLSLEEEKELDEMEKITPVYAVKEKGADDAEYNPCYLDYNGLKVLISELAKIIRN